MIHRGQSCVVVCEVPCPLGLDRRHSLQKMLMMRRPYQLSDDLAQLHPCYLSSQPGQPETAGVQLHSLDAALEDQLSTCFLEVLETR